MTDPVYLDFNATTPVAPEVRDAMLPYLGDRFGNPSSRHAFGVRMRAAIDEARARVARLLGCAPDEILFSSGGTESNNLAIFGTLGARPDIRTLVTSAVEHPAIGHPARVLAERGIDVAVVAVDGFGRVDPAAVAARAVGPAIVTILHAQNETGTLQPIAEIARSVRDRGVVVHTDAAQSVGKVPVRVDDLGVDLLSIAGHKLYAPPGVGALYVRRGTPLSAVTFGADHERGLRPGTENVPGVVGLGVACEIAHLRLADDAARIGDLARTLRAELAREIPGLVQNGHPDDRLPNTLNLSFPGVRGSELLDRAADVLASTGSACHDATAHPSAVLSAMGIAPDRAHGAVRLSLGRTTTRPDVDRAARSLVEAYRALRPPAPG